MNISRYFTGLCVALLLFFPAAAQTVNGSIRFEDGQVLSIETTITTKVVQHTGQQVIDFTVKASGFHQYEVTGRTDTATRLLHLMHYVTYLVDGMGRQIKLDSRREQDLASADGPYLKDLLQHPFTIQVDSNGKTISADPVHVQVARADKRLALVNNLVPAINNLVQPPLPGTPSIFHLLPTGNISVGDEWKYQCDNESGKVDEKYRLDSLTSDRIYISCEGNATTVTQTQVMGHTQTTTLAHTYHAWMKADRASGILLEKKIQINSNGSSKSQLGAVPVTETSTVIIHITPLLPEQYRNK